MKAWIKNYLFWRKYRYYRKDEITQYFIQNRLKTRKLYNLVQHVNGLYMAVKKDNARMTIQISLYKGKILEYEKRLKKLKTSPEKCKIKKSFTLAHDARVTLDRWKKQNASKFGKATIYMCNICEKWHITTNKGEVK